MWHIAHKIPKNYKLKKNNNILVLKTIKNIDQFDARKELELQEIVFKIDDDNLKKIYWKKYKDIEKATLESNDFIGRRKKLFESLYYECIDNNGQNVFYPKILIDNHSEFYICDDDKKTYISNSISILQ